MFEPFKTYRQKAEIAFQINEADESHIDDILEITLQRESGDIEKFRAELNTYFKNQKSKIYVAIANNKVVGFAKSKFYSGKSYTYEGWYLSGIIVKSEYRGAGIGRALTNERIRNLKPVADKIYYFANSNNKVSIKLHDSFGFQKVAQSFSFPGVKFSNGRGCLYELSTNDL